MAISTGFSSLLHLPVLSVVTPIKISLQLFHNLARPTSLDRYKFSVSGLYLVSGLTALLTLLESHLVHLARCQTFCFVLVWNPRILPLSVWFLRIQHPLRQLQLLSRPALVQTLLPAVQTGNPELKL